MERKRPLISGPVLQVVLLVTTPLLIFVLCLLGGAGKGNIAVRSVPTPPAFEKPVTSTSPDGKLCFTAEGSGILRLCDVRTGRMLQAHWESPANYKGITRVTWRGNRRVLIDLVTRHPAPVSGRTYIWDSVTGAWHNR